MEKSITITLIIVAGILILGFAGLAVFSNTVNPMQDKFTVTGESVIKATPDLVAVYFSTKSTAATSANATQQNAEIVEDLRTALIKQGFENKDIQTLNFNVYEDYDYLTSRRLLGYTASQTIRVELSTEDYDKIGEVIDAGVEAGVQISYINFELSKTLENQYKAEAIKLASEDARVKAEALAGGFNKKLGKLSTVSVNNWGYYPFRAYETMASDSTAQVKEAVTSIVPSEQDITASVQAVYSIR